MEKTKCDKGTDVKEATKVFYKEKIPKVLEDLKSIHQYPQEIEEIIIHYGSRKGLPEAHILCFLSPLETIQTEPYKAGIFEDLEISKMKNICLNKIKFGGIN